VRRRGRFSAAKLAGGVAATEAAAQGRASSALSSCSLHWGASGARGRREHKGAIRGGGTWRKCSRVRLPVGPNLALVRGVW